MMLRRERSPGNGKFGKLVNFAALRAMVNWVNRQSGKFCCVRAKVKSVNSKLVASRYNFTNLPFYGFAVKLGKSVKW